MVRHLICNWDACNKGLHNAAAVPAAPMTFSFAIIALKGSSCKREVAADVVGGGHFIEAAMPHT